jgi:phosphopantothenoylcysteine decarboxylase/phosphopantothenate--cysteine ligase
VTRYHACMEATTHRPTVVVGVTGGIAAYKACEVARELMRADVRVKVVMTTAAQRFVTPLTFRTLTGEPVAVSLWDDPSQRVHHISLAEEADVVVVVPCTANVIAKMAHGRADDILTTTLLATEAPIVIAPAMNTHMWRKEVTQANVTALRERGVVFVEPGTGELACGDTGEGRLATVSEIVDATLAALRRVRSLEGVRLLVTAGPTREPIDPVRFVGNRSSGRQGYAVAEEGARRGADVTLVSGPVSLPVPFGVRCVRVETAAEMRDAVMAAYPDTDAVVMTAAVADLRPADTAAAKLKKDAAPDTLSLERTDDILAGLGADKGGRVLIGFAAETEDVVGYARGKLIAKNLDLVVGNDISEPGVGFDSTVNRVVFVSADREEPMPVMDKRVVASALLDRLADLLKER